MSKQSLNRITSVPSGNLKDEVVSSIICLVAKMDLDIQLMVKRCHICQVNRNAPPPAPLHPWEYPSKPWSRIHIDHLGPFNGRQILVVVDSFSKWIEATVVKSTSTSETLEKLRQMFSAFGLSDRIVSDNGTSFTSKQFEEFVSKNGIIHTRVSPYHPASNGLAERAVQSVKRGTVKSAIVDTLK